MEWPTQAVPGECEVAAVAVEVVAVVGAVELPLAARSFLEALEPAGDVCRNESGRAPLLRSRGCVRMERKDCCSCSHQNGHSKDYEEGAPNPLAWATKSAGPVLISTTI
jgi:hypothetical protein